MARLLVNLSFTDTVKTKFPQVYKAASINETLFVQVCVVLLCFALLCFTDIAFFKTH